MQYLGSRAPALAIVAMLMLATIQLLPASTGQGTVQNSGLVVNTFDDMLSDRDILFPGPGYNDQTALVLPNHAFVDSATVNMSFGTFPGSSSAPWDPALDVGDDGSVEWAFDSDRGGPVGLQDTFSDGSREVDMEFLREGYKELFVQLPREATVTKAYVDVEGYPIPQWVQQYLLTPKTDSPGEYGPKMEEYDGDMWVIWESSDQNITTGGDADIVVRRFDGTKWYRIIELSTPGDTDEDDIPHLVAYKDKLYAIWSRGDARATAGGNSELVYRAYDGTEWGPITRFSGPKEDGLNTYERCIVFEDKLYVFWKSTDPNYCNHEPFSRDLDIVYTAFDGEDWEPIQELTDTANKGEDWSVAVEEFRGGLYVIWDTWWEGATGRRGNVDVVYRALIGGTWTSRQNLSPFSDRSVVTGGVQDALPRFYSWDNPMTGEEELFAIWMRGQTILPPSYGDGYTIVYRRYTGSSWLPMEQLSHEPEGEPVDQMFPSLVGFNDTLYAIWTLGTNTTSRPEGSTTLIATYGDIVIRSFDGETWSPHLELTPLGNGYDNASHPSIYIYDGKVFAAWETPLPTGHGTNSWEIVMRHLEISPVNISIEIGDGDDSVLWGWERLSNTKRRVHFDPEDLTMCLNGSPYTTDGYGNRYTELPIRVSDRSAARLRLSNLTIEYDFRVTVDFTQDTEVIIAKERDNTHVDKPVEVPFKVSTGQAGRITLEDPVVVYKLDYPPFMVGPVPDQQVLEDEGRDYLVDLTDYFADDWDNESLSFIILSESDPELVDAYLIGTWLSVRLPKPNGVGEVVITVRAFDRHPFYFNDSNEFTIRVVPVNDAPILHFIPDEELEVDIDHVDYLTATDVDEGDQDKLVFTTDSDIVKVRPDGRLEVVFRSYDPEVIYFNVTVTDPHGANDSQEVRFNYTLAQVRVRTEDDFPYALFLLLLLVLALVVAERMRRPYRMSEDEAIWDEEAEWEEREEVRSTGQWWRRFF